MPQPICGIDVSKATLDCFCQGRAFAVSNDPDGHRELLDQLPDAATVVFEPTGRYHFALLGALAKRADIDARQVNPLQLHRYRQARGRGDKTDQLDAALLAEFAATAPAAPTGSDAATPASVHLTATHRPDRNRHPRAAKPARGAR